MVVVTSAMSQRGRRCNREESLVETFQHDALDLSFHVREC